MFRFVLLLLVAHGAVAATPTPEELAKARDTADACFAHPDKPGPIAFSFNYGGIPSAEMLGTWEARREAAGTIAYVEPRTKLKVLCDYVAYKDFPVLEWTIRFRNEGTEDSPIISEINVIDQAWFTPAGGTFTLNGNKGDNNTADSYAPFEESLAPGAAKRIANTGGRPTQSAFPFFNIGWTGGGMIYALSWAGQWSTEFENLGPAGLRVRGGQERTHFILHPGEEVRGPMAVLMFYDGDRLRAQNLWRAWMLAHNTPRPGGVLPPSPQLAACSSHQFGEMIHADTASQKFFIDQYLARGMKLDYWWMDAGWYWNTEGWPQTGTWEVDTKRFPGGLRPISDHAHANGVKIITWFEPERVAPGTWLAKEHPEWISGGAKGGLLDLGNPAARAWLSGHVNGLLDSEGIDLYRQDFNMDPLDAWRNGEPENRQGIREIRHVEGYFAYWDALRARHPEMLIDSCASGGRRNDLETLRRAVPLLRSDYIMEPTGNQAHTWALASWFPYFGTGTSKTSPYEILSVLCPHFTACWDMRDEKLDYGALSTLVARWKEFAPLFMGDYYPLSPYTLAKEDWMAWQFHDAAKDRGMVQAFRREASNAAMATYHLQGLNPDAVYSLNDLNGVPMVEASGRSLMEAGLSVSIAANPGATVVRYEVK